MAVEWTPIIVAAVAGLATVTAAYFTSRAAGRAAAQREHGELAAQLQHLQDREPADIAELREGQHALAADVATLRKAYEDRARHDDERREKAAGFARERERDQNEVLSAIRIEIARLQERLNERTSALSERMEDRRGRR
jgi:hypothetical protein